MLPAVTARPEDPVSAWSAQLYRRRMTALPARHHARLDLADRAFTERRFAEAREHYLHLLESGLEDGDADCRLLHCADWLADWETRGRISGMTAARVMEEARRGMPGTEPLAYLSLELDQPSQCHLARARAKLFPPDGRTFPAVRQSRRRIRVGYLSIDFRSHSSGGHLGPLLAAHDPDLVEVVACSLAAGTPPPGVAAAERCLALGHLSVAGALRALRQEQFDVLIDTTHHLRDGAAWLANHRVAPLQISAWGYGEGVGLDVRLTDAVMNNGGSGPEEIVREIHCYPAVEPLRISAGSPPGNGLVLAALSSPYKVAPGLFGRWLDILTAVPGSVLWLADGPPEFADNLRRRAGGHGVNPDRLVFLPPLPPAAHLARLARVDLYLDNPWLGGGHGVFDALACGRPVLAWPACSRQDRSAASLLTVLGLGGLIPQDSETYVQDAISFCREPRVRQYWAQALASARTVGPEANIRALEQAFREWLGI